MNLLINIKKRPVEFGYAMLFILPPLGMAVLAWFGCKEWVAIIRRRSVLSTDPVSILFMLVTLASVGAAIANRQVTDLLSTAMLAGYYGIYLYLLNNPGRLRLAKYLWITILGGVYLYFSNQFYDVLSHFITIPPDVNLMTGHLLMGFSKQNRLYGSAYNPNYACYLLILALSLLLVELLRSIKLRSMQKIAAELVALPILGFSIYETGSRAGFVIMILLLLLFTYNWNKKIFISVSILAVACTPFIFNAMPRTDSTGFSMQQRLNIWKNSFKLFTDHPLFGTTSLGFPDAYHRLTGHTIAHAHNLLLSVFASSGVVCGIFFTWLLIAGSISLIWSLKKEKGYLRTTLFFFSLPTIIAYGLLDFTLSSPQVMLVVIALVSFWVRDQKQQRGSGRHHFLMLHYFRSTAESRRANKETGIADPVSLSEASELAEVTDHPISKKIESGTVNEWIRTLALHFRLFDKKTDRESKIALIPRSLTMYNRKSPKKPDGKA
ncbi:O-antigen ligase family protein [Sporolactobacillus pectinivorans]|uniref:O-antigen ligase family protein n=1 Tax=Sporolactobacillus pectinivorans TaxID=1591408 RepID=UPI001EFEBE37|nr:O-antigen ligase family protein [Sporolactobacillus pectinivorans]